MSQDTETMLRLVAEENKARLAELRGDTTTSQHTWRAVSYEWAAYALTAEVNRKALGYLSAALAALECGEFMHAQDCARRGLRCTYVPAFVGAELRDILQTPKTRG